MAAAPARRFPAAPAPATPRSRAGPAGAGGAAAPSGRAGVTFVEVLVALGIFSLLFVVFWQLYRGAQMVDAYYRPGMGAQQDLQIAMARMVEEIREGIEIFYPTPPPPASGDIETRAVTATGIGFLNVAGEPIMYFIEERDTDPITGKPRPQALVRSNLVSKKSERVAGNVKLFRVIVPPFRIGKKIARANLELSILKGRDEDASRLDRFDMITTIFLRNVSKDTIE
jgi:hypothetical protein